MKIVRTVEELTTLRNENSFNGKKLGFVPTMGALHEGHASLVRRSVAENDCTMVSVFVNPRQFNDPNDYKNYPITTDADIALLESVGCNVLYLPSADDIYNGYDGCKMDFHGLDKMYEGEFRPGHFQGVVDIVYRLFDLVKPDFAYFGEKDFQQIAVIRRMVQDLGFKIEIIPCPVIREESGLAMSSRNTLLSAEERIIAANIYRILKESKTQGLTLKETEQWVISQINAIEGLEVEYYSIVDGKTLSEVHDWTDSDDIVGCITVYCGKTPIRLIDHIRYK